MKYFRQLKVWEKSHELALAIYHITASFPREETKHSLPRFAVPLPRFRPISLKDAVEKEMLNWPAFASSPDVPPVNWSINSCWGEI